MRTDEDEPDVEYYPVPSGDDIEDPLLRESWQEAKRILTEQGFGE